MPKKPLSLAALLLLAASGMTCRDHPTHAQDHRASVYPTQQKPGVKMESMPLACNLTAMTAEQRQHYGEVKIRLRSAVTEVKELPNGYAFRYEPDPALVIAAAEFTTLESRCCPFFSFVLEVQGNGGPVWLRITGPKAAKSFIKEALAC